jgi:DNA-binding transcriptional MerR regulator
VAWSTRELAELAGTTVNTVRHYHRLGLLEEPQRRHNGYKQYGARELARLVRIRRLVELGVPLARIGEAGSDGTVLPETLRQVDAGLAADIERLIRARTGIAAILRDSTPADRVPDGAGHRPAPYRASQPIDVAASRMTPATAAGSEAGIACDAPGSSTPARVPARSAMKRCASSGML